MSYHVGITRSENVVLNLAQKKQSNAKIVGSQSGKQSVIGTLMQTLCLRKKLKLNVILFHQNLTQVVEIYNHIDQAVVKMNLLSEEELEEVLFVI